MTTHPQPSKPKRLAPTLFVPPSRNISSTDLSADTPTAPPQTLSSTRVPLLHQRSALARGSTSSIPPPPSTSPPRPHAVPAQPASPGGAPRRHRRTASSTTQTWTELQNTLEEVELSAAGGANVFGAEHSHALEELRNAQIELARAWARGEEGEGEGDPGGLDEGGVSLGGEGKQGVRETGGVLARDQGDGADGGDGGTRAFGIDKTQLEEETENDILLARKRRLANDRYFEKVNKGVLDVVAKLDLVANKMGMLEFESQDIWGEDSADGDSLA